MQSWWQSEVQPIEIYLTPFHVHGDLHGDHGRVGHIKQVQPDGLVHVGEGHGVEFSEAKVRQNYALY